MQYIRKRHVVLLADILESAWGAVEPIADYHLVLHHQGSDLPTLALPVLCPYLRHSQIAQVEFLLFLIHCFFNNFISNSSNLSNHSILIQTIQTQFKPFNPNSNHSNHSNPIRTIQTQFEPFKPEDTALILYSVSFQQCLYGRFFFAEALVEDHRMFSATS